MVEISLGGKALNPPAPPEPEPKVFTDLGYVMFDAVTWCQMNRTQALRFWNRYQKLQARVDANPNHPDNPRALSRMSQINNEFLKHQVQFLGWEKMIHHYWKHATVDEITASDSDELCNALPTDSTLPSLWHHPLGSQEGATLTCPMTTTALQFSTREMSRRYHRIG